MGLSLMREYEEAHGRAPHRSSCDGVDDQSVLTTSEAAAPWDEGSWEGSVADGESVTGVAFCQPAFFFPLLFEFHSRWMWKLSASVLMFESANCDQFLVYSHAGSGTGGGDSWGDASLASGFDDDDDGSVASFLKREKMRQRLKYKNYVPPPSILKHRTHEERQVLNTARLGTLGLSIPLLLLLLPVRHLYLVVSSFTCWRSNSVCSSPFPFAV